MRGSVYTVRQVNSYIKNMFVQDYMLNRINVKGEVSNCKYHNSGHLYFTLKDESGTIDCVMFAGQRYGLGFRMEEGQNVIVTGSVSVYERSGRYQVYAREIVLDGAGDLYQRFLQLKQDLEDMGLFAEEYKQPIPRYAQTVGIVTSANGAALQDIRNIAGRRNPYVQLVLYPALVQGEGAAESIVRGIQALDAYGVDVMIVGRGGGSIEDLWAFNEEIVARAVFECSTPVISAVGHETDFTIIDFAADLRAPTPSAAAELAVYEVSQAYQQLEAMRLQMQRSMRLQLDRQLDRLERFELRLQYASPRHQLQQRQQYAGELEEKLRSRIERVLQNKKHALELYARQLQGLSPLERLSRGYVFAADAKGHAIKDIEQVQRGEIIQIHVINGRIDAEVKDTAAVERQAADGR